MARGASSLWAGICISIFDASRGWFCSFAGLALELFGRSRCSYAYYKGQKMWAEKACTLKKKSKALPCDLLYRTETAPQQLAGSKASHRAGGSVVGWGLGGPLPHPATLSMPWARKSKWKWSAFSSAAGNACLHPMPCSEQSGCFKSSPGPRRLFGDLRSCAGVYRVWESQCL